MATQDRKLGGRGQDASGETASGSVPGESVPDDVGAEKTVTAKRALRVLEGGADNGHQAGSALELVGQKIANPEQAYRNLQQALGMVKRYFGDQLRVDLSDLQFQKFHGDIVGEAREEGTFIDPIMLMHPAIRLAHVIAHELAHDRKRILNEGLVEAYVHLFFGDTGIQHTYEKCVEDFREFARRFGGESDVETSVKKLYEFYYADDFEAIYDGYERNYIDKLQGDDARDEAFSFFRRVFPELEYSSEKKPGECCLKTLPRELGRGEAEVEKSAGKAA